MCSIVGVAEDTDHHVILREQNDRGNLPVGCSLLHLSSIDCTRRLPRPVEPRNDMKFFEFRVNGRSMIAPTM